jgi:hypothetical protein
MAFLDNAGDIILDAVLTDTGRMRLAKGDGSFRVAKFAFGDDEINYGLYDLNNVSGSAYYDLTILQSPIFEAFTNNTSVMKSKLLTIARNDLLYLPVLKLNTLTGVGPTADVSAATLTDNGTAGIYVVAADETAFDGTSGLLRGNDSGYVDSKAIVIDQGLDSNAEGLEPLRPANPLTETQYIVEMDNRLATLVSPDNDLAEVSFIDDDQVASYFVSLEGGEEGLDKGYFYTIGQNDSKTANVASPLAGRPGLRFQFKLKASQNLQSSNYLFDTIGATGTNINGITGSSRYIDSTIRLTGFTTGYRVDIPVRFVKAV